MTHGHNIKPTLDVGPHGQKYQFPTQPSLPKQSQSY